MNGRAVLWSAVAGFDLFAAALPTSSPSRFMEVLISLNYGMSLTFALLAILSQIAATRRP